MFLALITLAITSALNRVRGGGLGAAHLPGHPRVYVAPVIGLLAGILNNGWLIGVVAGLGYFIWSLPPWGRWYTLGRMPRTISGQPDAFEIWVERISDGDDRNDHLALLIRHALGILPLIAVLVLITGRWWLAGWVIVFPVLAVAAYEACWRAAMRGKLNVPTAIAEWIVGCIFGLILLI